MTYRATVSGEWPTGIHWAEGEERALPAGYPVEGDVPTWLVPVAAAPLAPTKPRTRRGTDPEEG